jgi:hypothetical protein
MSPYYRGDNYYRGDYYQGDFLGLGKLAKGLVKTVGQVAGSFIKASPLGQVVTSAANILHPSLPPPKGLMLGPGGGGGGQFGLVNIGGQGTQGGLLNISGGGAPPPGALASIPGAITKGYHLNKETYETRGGGTSRWGPAGSLQIHPKGTTLVKNRRMNVGNARALKRALRRAGGFARLARRVMSFTHPRAGRGHFKFRRRGKR